MEEAPEEADDEAEPEVLDTAGDSDDELPAYAMMMEEDPGELVSEAPVFDGDWASLIGRLGNKLGAARMLAQNAALKQWDGKVFELAVPEGFRNMATRDYQDKLKSVLGEYLGQSIELRVSVETLDMETPAMRDARFKREQLAGARQHMENDPVVQQLVQEMGAMLLAETVQPVQE